MSSVGSMGPPQGGASPTVGGEPTSGDSLRRRDAFLDKLGKGTRALAIIDIAMLRFGVGRGCVPSRLRWRSPARPRRPA